MSDNPERRKSDFLFKVIFVLLALVQTIALAWLNKIEARAEKVPILEERIANIQIAVTKIEIGVERLLARK